MAGDARTRQRSGRPETETPQHVPPVLVEDPPETGLEPLAPATARPSTAQAPQSSPLRWRGTERGRPCAPSFLAAFLDVAPVLPTIIAIATLFTYVGGPTTIAEQLHHLPLTVGAVAGLLVGLVLIVLYRPIFTAADRAHPESYAEVRQRVDILAARLDVLHADAAMTNKTAVAEATSHCRALYEDLVKGGPQWVIGTGYVNALTRLHRAEESLIAVQPTDDVLADALFDEMRLSGARLTDVDLLRGKLRAAVEALSSTAATYLTVPPRHDPPTPHQNGATPAASGASDLLTTSEARIALRQIRRAINDFRDESRARLVRSRSRLLATMTFTGFITYVLLAFAVVIREGSYVIQMITPGDPIVAAGAIYLVGAVVGLFNRLYVESGDDAPGEDYGLSRARLLLTPMLSGLAAVGGVLITGMLSGVLYVDAVTPSASYATPTVATTASALSATATPQVALGATPSASPAAIPQGGGTVGQAFGRPASVDRRGALSARQPLSVRDVFTLEEYPFALVLAALFGLAPRTFLERLQRASDQTRMDLKSTEAHQPTPIPPRESPARNRS
jgi:hypothetical protein